MNGSDSDFGSDTSFTLSEYGKAYGKEFGSLYKNLQQECKHENADQQSVYSIPDLEDSDSDFALTEKFSSHQKGKDKDKAKNYSSRYGDSYIDPQQIRKHFKKGESSSTDPYTEGR